MFGFGVAVALPLIALSAYRQWEFHKHSSEEVQQNILNATTLVAERIEHRLQSANAILDVMSSSVRFDSRNRNYNDSLLGRWHTSGSALYGNYYAYTSDGGLVGTAHYIPALDSLKLQVQRVSTLLRTTPRMHYGIRGRSLVLTDSAYVILIMRGVFDNDSMLGMVALTARVDSLAEVVGVSSIVSGTEVAIFDTTGAVLAHFKDGKTIVPDSARSIAPVGMHEKAGVTRVTPFGSTERRLVGHTRAGSAPWYVNVSIPEAIIAAPQKSSLLRDLSVVLLAVSAALALAYVLGERIVRPLNILATDARTIARGVTNHRSRVTDSSEIGVLANAFNHMADTVEKRSAALADNERRYRLLFDSNPLPMWAWDADTLEVLAVNEAALSHYGYDRDTFLSLLITQLIDPSDHERFSKSRLPFSESRQNAGTWTHRTADGRRVEMDVITTSSRRLGRASWLSVGIDISARLEAERALAHSEEQLRQAQKMEAIGTFAGGIAHDFNNLLTGMLGYCDLALMDVERDSPLRRDLSEIRKLAVRGADLTRQILAVSRKQVVQTVILEPNAVVRGMDTLLARLIGEDIQVQTSLDESVSRIEADPGQLEQMLLNLASNARDAMPRGGVLQIRTYKVSNTERESQGLDSSKQWVAIAVADTGSGMTDEVRQRIFEPFFTTKERGKGTGLGLALAYSMLDQAGGSIRVDSQVGSGSTFVMYFPAVVEQVTIHQSGEHLARHLHGNETILIAEDEDAVRSIAVAALRRWGYSVLAAARGDEALAISRSHNGPVHLLLTDVIMPGMNGRELAEVLKTERPEMRVLYTSGYTDDAELLRGIRIDDLPFAQKPFTASELVHRVRDTLDDSPLHRS